MKEKNFMETGSEFEKLRNLCDKMLSQMSVKDCTYDYFIMEMLLQRMAEIKYRIFVINDFFKILNSEMAEKTKIPENIKIIANRHCNSLIAELNININYYSAWVKVDLKSLEYVRKWVDICKDYIKLIPPRL